MLKNLAADNVVIGVVICRDRSILKIDAHRVDGHLFLIDLDGLEKDRRHTSVEVRHVHGDVGEQRLGR